MALPLSARPTLTALLTTRPDIVRIPFKDVRKSSQLIRLHCVQLHFCVVDRIEGLFQPLLRYISESGQSPGYDVVRNHRIEDRNELGVFAQFTDDDDANLPLDVHRIVAFKSLVEVWPGVVSTLMAFHLKGDVLSMLVNFRRRSGVGAAVPFTLEPKNLVVPTIRISHGGQLYTLVNNVLVFVPVLAPLAHTQLCSVMIGLH